MISVPTVFNSTLRRLTWVAAAGLLVGCAGTAPHYYSLQGGEPEPRSATMVKADYAISVQPVVVPQQVARPQIVVRMEPGSEVVPLNSSLWVGPLESQIRGALAAELSRRLNVLDVGGASAGEGVPVWRVYVDLQRFDSLYGREIQQEVVWRLMPQAMPKGAKERVCSAQVTRPVETGMSALVEGHREALAGVAAAIAQSLPASGTASAKAANELPNGVAFRGCVE